MATQVNGWPMPDAALQAIVGRLRGDEWVAGGKKHVDEMIAVGGLKPEDWVLDVGCGPGRIAIHLSGFLAGAGQYAGLEVRPDCVAWFAEALKDGRLPNFWCKHLDAVSPCYNPDGKQSPSEVRFPLPDNQFSFIVGLSLFTHMCPAEMNHYLSEMRRVATPGAKLYLSMFLLDDEARQAINDGKVTGQLRFAHQVADGCWARSPKTPETAIAYERDYFLNALGLYGFRICNVYGGAWAPRLRLTPRADGQDLVIAVMEE